MRHRRLASITLLLAALAALHGLAACNIVGPIFYLVHGPEKIERVHELDPLKRTVIFVDDRQSLLPRQSLRVTLAEEAERLLMKQGAVREESMISTRSAIAAAGRDAYGKLLPITEIGRTATAEIVIYVDVLSFTLSGDGETFAPQAAMRVKVLDVATGERIWPTDREGYALSVPVRARQGQAPTSPSARARVHDELAKFAGEALARLFYTHEPSGGPRLPN